MSEHEFGCILLGVLLISSYAGLVAYYAIEKHDSLLELRAWECFVPVIYVIGLVYKFFAKCAEFSIEKPKEEKD